MHPALIGVGVLGGYIGYKHLTSPAGVAKYGDVRDLYMPPNPNNPAPKPPAQFWTDWFGQGNQVATGNGPPTTDQTAHDWAQGVTAVTKFATSLVNYFGTAQDDDAAGGGTSTGGPVAKFSNGGQDW